MTWFLFRKPILEASVVTTRAEEVLSEKSFQKTVYPTLEPSKKSAPAHENPQTLEQSPFDQFKDLCLKDGLLDSQESHDSWPRHIGIDDNPSLMLVISANTPSALAVNCVVLTYLSGVSWSLAS